MDQPRIVAEPRGAVVSAATSPTAVPLVAHTFSLAQHTSGALQTVAHPVVGILTEVVDDRGTAVTECRLLALRDCGELVTVDRLSADWPVAVARVLPADRPPSPATLEEVEQELHRLAEEFIAHPY